MQKKFKNIFFIILFLVANFYGRVQSQVSSPVDETSAFRTMPKKLSCHPLFNIRFVKRYYRKIDLEDPRKSVVCQNSFLMSLFKNAGYPIAGCASLVIAFIFARSIMIKMGMHTSNAYCWQFYMFLFRHKKAVTALIDTTTRFLICYNVATFFYDWVFDNNISGAVSF